MRTRIDGEYAHLISTECPASLDEADADDGPPLTADHLEAHHCLDGPEAERGRAPEKASREPKFVTVSKRSRHPTGKE